MKRGKERERREGGSRYVRCARTGVLSWSSVCARVRPDVRRRARRSLEGGQKEEEKKKEFERTGERETRGRGGN